MRLFSSVGVALVAVTFSLTVEGACAASAVQKECSEKYQAAKGGGTLNGMTYNQFYSQCAAAAKAEPAPAAGAAPATAAAGTPPETKAELKAEKKAEKEKEKAEKKAEKEEKKSEKEKEKAEKKGEPAPAPVATAPAPTPAAPVPTTTAAKPAASAPMATGNATFPTAISSEFSSMKPGTARLKTCAKQYDANKINNGNGGLKWTEKGGGYYSECNKRLKG